jgi:type I restriction enzyme, S subunit
VSWPIVPLSTALASSEVFVDGDWVESKDQDPAGNVRLVQLADVGDGEYLNKSSRFLTSSKAGDLKCTYLKPGDILVARMPHPLGRACIFPGDRRPSVTVVDVCIIRPDGNGPDGRFLVHCLNSSACRHQIAGFAIGTTRSRISRSNLAKVKIPLPPMPQQRRIAAILDKADALRASRRKALAEIDKLTQSIFLDMFGDPVTNPRGWPLAKLQDIGSLDRGVSRHRPRNAPELLGGAYPFVQTGDIASCDGYIRSFTDTYSEAGLKQSKMWPKGTLCITIAANIAKTGILTFDACFPDSVVGFRCDDAATFQFVRVSLSFFQKWLEDAAPESAQKNINLAILRRLEIPKPGVELQRDFANRLASVERLMAPHRASLRELDALFASVQHRAFRGEL